MRWNINQFLSFIWPQSFQQATHQPLLQQSEIERIRHLAEKPYRTTPHQHEVEHRQYGDSRSVYRGYGLDYEESRLYQAGDEMRFMNWRLSARSNELYMKVFREERRPSVFILLDRRQSMRFGSQTQLKVTQAARVAAHVSFIAKQNNSPIAGVILNKTTKWIPEASGETGVYNLVNQAISPCPPLNNDNNEVSLEHTLKILLNMLVKGSIVYLISDFHDLDDTAQPLLLQLSEEHKLVSILVNDPVEIKLPDSAAISIYNPQTNDDIYLDTKQKNIQENFQQQAQRHFHNIQNRLSLYSEEYINIDTQTAQIEQLIPAL